MKKSFRLTIAIFVVLLIAVAILTARPPIQKHIYIPQFEPSSQPGSNRASQFPPISSQVVVTARIPFDEIRDLVQRSITSNIGGEIHVGDAGGFSGITVRPSLARDPVALSPLVGSEPPKVYLTTGLHGRVNVKAFKWIIINLLLGTLKTQSPEVSQDVDVAARIDGWISPGINQGWGFTHQEHFNVHVDRAEAKIFGIIPISLKDEVQKGVNGAAPGMIKDALDSLAAKLPIRAEMEKVWKELYKPVKVAQTPDAYALLKPDLIRLQKVAFDDPNTLTIRAALDVKCATDITTKPPEAAPPAPLPPLIQESVISPQFHVVVPLILGLPEINKALRKLQVKTTIKLDENSSIDISDPSFYSKNRLLYVKITAHGNNKKVNTVIDGIIYLKFKLSYDNSLQQLRIKDIGFEFETKNVLASIAAWLLNDLICQKVEDTLRLDVSEQLTKLKQEVNERFATIEAVPGVRLNSRLAKIGFTGVQALDNTLIAGFDLTGEISCDISVNALK